MADNQPQDELDLHIMGGILLPNDHCDFSRSARSVFPALAATGRYFVRGKAVQELTETGLETVTVSAFRTRLDRFGSRVVAYVQHKDKLALVPKRCSEDNAKALLATLEVREILPKIRLVTKMPIIVPAPDSAVKILNPGYHKEHETLVTGNDIVRRVPFDLAISLLKDLLADFDFPSPGDNARAVAEIITPALRMGGWLEGPVPVHAAEADVSQSGKTLRQEMTRGIYGETAYLVPQKNGGVGSFDESLSSALLSGKPFVAMDNVRGKVDSPFLGAAVTWGEMVSVRVPHSGEMQIDATRITFQLSSNGIEVTRDLANRMSITRIRRQKPGHKFRMGRSEILSLIKKDRCLYLGCVFAVVERWASAGRPSLPDVPHDFQEWAGPLAWIVQECFGLGPLMEAHIAAQGRVSDPALSWLRNVCLAATRTKRLDEEMLASAIADLCESESIDIPGLPTTTEDDRTVKHIGKLLARCFKSGDDPSLVSVDGFDIRKTETSEQDGGYRTVVKRRYRISRSGQAIAPTPETPCVPILSKEGTPFPEQTSLIGGFGGPGFSTTSEQATPARKKVWSVHNEPKEGMF